MADFGVRLGVMVVVNDTAGVCPRHSAPSGVQALAPGPTPGFVALSRFVVANGMASDVKTAFRNRPHLVEGASGYLRMEVLSPLERPEELWLLTVWTDEASFTAWHHSHLYRGAHAGIPKGLRLVPSETELRRFEHVAC